MRGGEGNGQLAVGNGEEGEDWEGDGERRTPSGCGDAATSPGSPGEAMGVVGVGLILGVIVCMRGLSHG